MEKLLEKRLIKFEKEINFYKSQLENFNKFVENENDKDCAIIGGLISIFVIALIIVLCILSSK